MGTVYMSFANQKGGVGKTTFTSAFASFIHYQTKLNVLVVDADFPQHSLLANRQRDTERVNADAYLKQLAISQYRVTNKKAYPILKATPETAIQVAKNYLSKNNNFHIVLFDLPGTVQSDGVLFTLSSLDVVFIPLIADRIVLESSLAFATTLDKTFRQNENVRLKDIYLFWNQVDGREKSDLYSIYEGVVKELNLVFLKNYVVDTKRFRKEIISERKQIFRSTLFSSSRRYLRDSNLEKLILEITKIVLS